MSSEKRLSEVDARIAAARVEQTAAGRQARVEAQLDKVWLLLELDRADDALRVVDEAAASLDAKAELADPLLGAHVANARGQILEDSEPEAALVSFDEALVIITQAGTDDEASRSLVIDSLYRKALLLHGAGRYGEAVAASAEIINRFGDDAPADARGEVINAMVLFCALAALLDQPQAAIDGYARLIGRLSGDPSEEARGAVAMARIGRANLLGRQGDLTGAVAELDRAQHELGTNPAVAGHRGLAAKALNDRAHWLRSLGRDEDAARDYALVLEQFRVGEDDEIDSLIDEARQELAQLRR